MKTYILTEKIMNGTVTINIITTIFRSQNFEKIVNKLKSKINELDKQESTTFSIEIDDGKEFSYIIQGEDFPLYGCILNKEQKIVTV